MSYFWRMGRGRVFRTVSKAFTTIARVQFGTPLKLEQVAEVNGSFWIRSSLGAQAPCFFRPVSVGTETVPLNDEMPQRKLNGVVEDYEEKLWSADMEEYLNGFCSETTLALLHKATKLMKPTKASEFLNWAAQKQVGPTPIKYFYNMLFRSFLHAGKFDNAVEVLEEMKKADISVNLKSFCTLAFFYVKAGMKVEAEETLDLMKSFGVGEHPEVYRCLLREYILTGDEEGIERLVQRSSNMQGFDLALEECAELGKGEVALKLLDRMEADGIDMKDGTIHTAIECLCSSKMIDEALKLVKKAKEKGYLSSLKVFNILIRSLVEEKRLNEALELVSNMKDIDCKPNTRTHNILISGYLNSGQTEKALTHLEEMKVDGCRPTNETLSLFKGILNNMEQVEILEETEGIEEDIIIDIPKRILEICEGKLWSADIEDALSEFSNDLTNKLVKKVLQKMHVDNLKDFFHWAGKQKGYSHGRNEYKALIRRFVHAGNFDSAMEFIEEMWEKDVKIVPNDFAKVVYHSGKAGKIAQAKEVVEMMNTYGLDPDEKVYGAFLSAHLEANDDQGVANVLQSLSDVEQFNSAISAFARAGKVDSVLKVLEIMKEKDCSRNLQTYDLVVRCLCSAGRIEDALEAFQNMQGEGLVPDVKIYNVLIDHLCQEKRVDEALKLFSQMKEIGCRPNVVTHNSLITGYLRLGQAAKAHKHMELMKAEGCPPTRETSRLFVVNLSMSEELDKAVQEFQKAVECGKLLSIDACNCLLKALIKAGKLDEALRIFEDMKGIADRSSYVVMLRGCCNLSKFDVIERLLAEVRIRNIQLPVSTYVVLLQTYSRAKIFKKVAFLFKELQESGQSLNGPRTNTAVLDALNRAHQLDMGVKFCEYLVDHDAKINSRQLKHFFRLLIKSGRAGEATELQKNLSEKGLVILERSQLEAA